MSDDTKTEDEEPTPEPIPQAVASVDDWNAAKIFKGITLPSGTVVDITLPDLPELAKAGDIPNELLDVAAKIQKAVEDERGLDADALVNVASFQEYILPRMLVKPEITAEDVGRLPAADKELLTAIASRKRDLDAVGHQLAGLETQASWRRFREFDLAAAGMGG
jgi:hypothetical protein